nr:DNA helicase [Tanacetum cinerariifolium]
MRRSHEASPGARTCSKQRGEKKRPHQFEGEESGLKREMVEGWIEFLNNNNAVIQFFRTARNKMSKVDIPEYQVRIDFLRAKQNEIRNEFLSTLYYAITRGDQDGRDAGSRIILPVSFTGGPRQGRCHRPRTPTLGHIFALMKSHLATSQQTAERSKVCKDEDVDAYVSAELPDPIVDPKGLRDRKCRFGQSIRRICSMSVSETINSALCAEGDMVLVVASPLLPSGRTAHSRFKLPLDLPDESMCDIKNNTQMADLLKQTDLTIWDEAPMNDRPYQTLRDILDVPDKLFGNKLVILGGDFWQTLFVKKKASKNEWVTYCIDDTENAKSDLINFIYDDETLQRPTAKAFHQAKSIVCPKYETADVIISHVLAMLSGERYTYRSHDGVIPHGNDGGSIQKSI